MECHIVLQDGGHGSLLHFFSFTYYWGYVAWPVQIQIETSASYMMFHSKKKTTAWPLPIWDNTREKSMP
jgi:hypothetical protein